MLPMYRHFLFDLVGMNWTSIKPLEMIPIKTNLTRFDYIMLKVHITVINSAGYYDNGSVESK